jgi:hypothetical protein
MGHTSSDRNSADFGASRPATDKHAVVRLAVPDGWVPVDTGDTVHAITVDDWSAGSGFRPTMAATVSPTTSAHAAARALADAQASLQDMHVVSIDPWPVSTPVSTLVGRRLVFAHTDGDATLCTLLWVVTTDAGDVTVSARVESTHLETHDQAFAYAVAGIELPVGATDPATPDAGITADLARRATAAPWTELAPEPGGARSAIVADPDARILVEATVGSTSLRFDANLAGDAATVVATSSPREVSQRGVSAAEAETTTFRIPVTKLALAVTQWLGLGPAWTASFEPVAVPISEVMHRLVDPTTPAPDGVDQTTWQQPWFLWTLRSSATDSGLVMVDTGTSGQCAVMQTDDDAVTRFAPLSSYTVWLTLNWLVSESLVA